MVNVAIIPARGGSKRIPRKNIKPFHGKPIIAYSIEVALQSDLFERVIVSTDDEEIAAVAEVYGAEAPFVRPQSLSDDFTGTHAVVNHAIEFINNQGCALDYACCIYATAPLLQVRYLQQAYAQLINDGRSLVFSAAQFPSSIQRAFSISEGEGENLIPFNKQAYTKRSQDLTEFYHDAGQFYWGVPKAFTENYNVYCEHSDICLLPRYEVCDIDSQEDWLIAEKIYEQIHGITKKKT